MREIKFRAWDKNQLRWVDEYIDLLHDGSRAVGGNPTDFDVDDIDPGECDILLYTGLKDKNGKEIYEGDIIKAKHDVGDYDIGSVVYGRKGAFCIDLPKVATGIKSPLLNYIHGIMFDESDIEVIGNIYENKELLK